MQQYIDAVLGFYGVTVVAVLTAATQRIIAALAQPAVDVATLATAIGNDIADQGMRDQAAGLIFGLSRMNAAGQLPALAAGQPVQITVQTAPVAPGQAPVMNFTVQPAPQPTAPVQINLTVPVPQPAPAPAPAPVQAKTYKGRSAAYSDANVSGSTAGASTNWESDDLSEHKQVFGLGTAESDKVRSQRTHTYFGAVGLVILVPLLVLALVSWWPKSDTTTGCNQPSCGCTTCAAPAPTTNTVRAIPIPGYGAMLQNSDGTYALVTNGSDGTNGHDGISCIPQDQKVRGCTIVLCGPKVFAVCDGANGKSPTAAPVATPQPDAGGSAPASYGVSFQGGSAARFSDEDTAIGVACGKIKASGFETATPTGNVCGPNCSNPSDWHAAACR